MGRVNRVFSNMSASPLNSMLMLDERGMEGMLSFLEVAFYHTGEAPGL